MTGKRTIFIRKYSLDRALSLVIGVQVKRARSLPVLSQCRVDNFHPCRSFVSDDDDCHIPTLIKSPIVVVMVRMSFGTTQHILLPTENEYHDVATSLCLLSSQPFSDGINLITITVAPPD